MLYVLTMLVCLVTGFLIKDSRIIGFIGMMVLSYLAGDANPMTTLDYPVYSGHYYLLGSEVSPFEHGYTLMSKLFFDFGFSYAQFRLISMILTFIVLFLGVSMFTKKVALFTGLYGITVFFNDATQVRNLMMISLVILGSGFLTRQNKFIKLFGVLILIISTQFHDLGFAFLIIILLFNFLSMSKLNKFFKYFIIILYLSGIFFSSSNKTVFVKLISSFLMNFSSRSNSAENVLIHFGRGNGISEVILVWLMLMLVIVVLKVLLNSARRLGIYDTDIIKILFIGSGVSLVTIFLILLSPDYSRIARNSFLFLLMFICVILEHKGRITITKTNFSKVILVLCLLVMTSCVNTIIWGSSYYESIPYLAKIK